LHHHPAKLLTRLLIVEPNIAIASGYQPGYVLFGGVDEEILGCIPDRVREKIVNALSKRIGFPKLERDLINYRKRQITGSLFYSNLRYKIYYLFF
jgi:hypothetical protein